MTHHHAYRVMNDGRNCKLLLYNDTVSTYSTYVYINYIVLYSVVVKYNINHTYVVNTVIHAAEILI